LTVLEMIMLVAGGMPVFESVCHSFSTAGTGGFSVKNASIGAYDSDYIQIVIGVFMLLFGINFNVFYLLLIRKVKQALFNQELRLYLGIAAFSVAAVTINTLGMFENQIGDFASLFGRVGIAKYVDWMRDFVTCKILRIGRFNFEIEKAWDFAVFTNGPKICIMPRETLIHKSGRVLGSVGCEDTDGSFEADIVEADEYFEGYPTKDGLCEDKKIRLYKSEWKKVLDNGDLVISVHIPAGEPLDFDKNTEDLRRAAKIFESIYGRIHAFYCNSWMLDPSIEKIQGKKTGLTRFGDRFVRFPTKSKGKSVFTYLFNTAKTDDIDALPENTSMQRAIKAHLKSGGHIYGAQGIILIDDKHI